MSPRPVHELFSHEDTALDSTTLNGPVVKLAELTWPALTLVMSAVTPVAVLSHVATC